MTAPTERRKVTMTSYGTSPTGEPLKFEAVDYVAPDHLDAYVADARTRWGAVAVGDGTDHGPGGETGDYDTHAATHAPEGA